MKTTQRRTSARRTTSASSLPPFRELEGQTSRDGLRVSPEVWVRVEPTRWCGW